MDGNRPRNATRSFLSISTVSILVWIVVVGFFGGGCRDLNEIPIDRNIPPETVLTGAPGDSQTTFYKVHLFWGGFDHDGEVTGFEWAITDSLPDLEFIEYKYTTKTDSTFCFQVQENSEVLGHRFYVRAIDDDGRVDPTPAFTFFAGRNTCAPTVDFTRARGVSPNGLEFKEILGNNQVTPADTVPACWDLEFGWEGEDCDILLQQDGTIDTVGRVDRYSYKLSPRELNFVGGTLGDTTAFYEGRFLRSGTYNFFVRAVDDAGFAGLDATVRSVVWNKDPITRWTRLDREDGKGLVGVCFVDTSLASDLPESEYVPIANGDTLPVTALGVKGYGEIFALDPDDCEGDGSVVSYQARLVDDTARWSDVGEDPQSGGRIFRFEGLHTDRSGWKLMSRSFDRLGREDGTPDSVVFYVNKAPRFVQERNGTSQKPLAGEVLEVTAGDLELPIIFIGVDPDPARPPTVLLDGTYRMSLYPRVEGGSAGETFFRNRDTDASWIFSSASSGIMQGSVTLPGRIVTPGEDPVPREFIPGDYKITLRIRERRPGNQAVLGQRYSQLTIPFRVVER